MEGLVSTEHDAEKVSEASIKNIVVIKYSFYIDFI